MNCKEILENILSRAGLYKNIPDPFASTDLVVQENIRILNQLVRELTIDNSLSELIDEAEFRTYSKWKVGKVEQGQIVYSKDKRYLCVVAGTSLRDPYSLGKENNKEYKDSAYSTTWKCLGDWNQYPLEDIADDIASIDTGTVMNKTQRQKMIALNAHQWAVLDASSTSAGEMFCIRDNSIYLFNGIEDGDVIKFAYYTSKPVISGDERKETFGSGNDTCKIPPLLLIYGTVYRYMSDKDIGNFDKFGQKYMELLTAYNARGQAPQQIDLAGGIGGELSNYTDGNWNV